jgi:hypothetical protein
MLKVAGTWKALISTHTFWTDCADSNLSSDNENCVNSWRDVIREKMYLILGIVMLMGMTQKPTLRFYFSRGLFVEVCFILIHIIMKHERFELIMKYMHN